MTEQKVPEGSADIQNQVVTNPVDLLLFDLKNEAVDYGLSAGESGRLQIAMDVTINSRKRQHRRIDLFRLKSRSLLHTYRRLKGKLRELPRKSNIKVVAPHLAKKIQNLPAGIPGKIVRN
jgi:hypothetical protein